MIVACVAKVALILLKFVILRCWCPQLIGEAIINLHLIPYKEVLNLSHDDNIVLLSCLPLCGKLPMHFRHLLLITLPTRGVIVNLAMVIVLKVEAALRPRQFKATTCCSVAFACVHVCSGVQTRTYAAAA